MSNEFYGQSSRAGFSPGMESTFIDHLLVRPHTSWRGVRGARAYFGADEEMDDIEDELDEAAEALSIEQATDEFWDLTDSELEMIDPDVVDEELYGRLYRSRPYEMVQASEGDLGALSSQSGWSGYRGGRPTFGAEGSVSMSPRGLEYRGNEIAAAAIAAGALVVFAKSVKLI